MKFLDLKQLQIIETEEYSTLNLTFDAGKILEMPLKMARDFIDQNLRVNFKNRYVFINVNVSHLNAEEEEFEEAEFEAVVNIVLNRIIDRNLTLIERTEKEKNKIMNRLTSGAWIVSSALGKEVSMNTALLRKCGDFKPVNKGLNIHITLTDGDLLYRLLDNNIQKIGE